MINVRIFFLAIAFLSNFQIFKSENLIFPYFVNKSDNATIEQNKTIKFNCQSNNFGCSVLFQNISITDSKVLEISIKLRNTELFDDISSGLGLW